MSRRRSKSMPEARIVGPVTASAIASSADRCPTPISRLRKIGFPVRRFEYSSIFSGNVLMKAWMRSNRSSGGSIDNPPIRKQLFDGQAVAEIVGHGAEIADAIGQRNNLLIELCLAGLLDARVQITNFR